MKESEEIVAKIHAIFRIFQTMLLFMDNIDKAYLLKKHKYDLKILGVKP